jgi:hypothetical protein
VNIVIVGLFNVALGMVGKLFSLVGGTNGIGFILFLFTTSPLIVIGVSSLGEIISFELCSIGSEL